MKAFNDVYRGKTVLVTGHTGFKGSWLSIWLTSLGAKVVGYALDPYSNRSNYCASHLKDHLFADERGDMRDSSRLEEVIAKYKPEIIFHLAAQALVRTSYQNPKYTYELTDSVEEKISKVATKVYGAANVDILPEASAKIKEFVEKGYGNLPICIAKTQYSLSDDPKKLGNPAGFTLTVRDCFLSAGAGYLVILTGTIVTMPGLPPHPAAMDIDIDNNGVITGLF